MSILKNLMLEKQPVKLECQIVFWNAMLSLSQSLCRWSSSCPNKMVSFLTKGRWLSLYAFSEEVLLLSLWTIIPSRSWFALRKCIRDAFLSNFFCVNVLNLSHSVYGFLKRRSWVSQLLVSTCTLNQIVVRVWADQTGGKGLRTLHVLR